MAATDDQARNSADQRIAELFNELAPALIYIRSRYGIAYPTNKVHGIEMYGRSAVQADRIWMTS
jgi:hypothetical protein